MCPPLMDTEPEVTPMKGNPAEGVTSAPPPHTRLPGAATGRPLGFQEPGQYTDRVPGIAAQIAADGATSGPDESSRQGRGSGAGVRGGQRGAVVRSQGKVISRYE